LLCFNVVARLAPATPWDPFMAASTGVGWSCFAKPAAFYCIHLR
jgi:hypothetical protein